MTRVHLLVLLCLTATLPSGCTDSENTLDRDGEVYLIPQGYVGRIFVVHDVPGGQPPEHENGNRVYRIPDDGFLLSQTDPNEGWIESDRLRYFYVDEDGKRTEILGRWSGAVHDTEQNRSDTQLRIFDGGIGTFQIGTSDCDLVQTNLYVGTLQDLLNQTDNYDLYSERGIEGVDPAVVQEACEASSSQ
ncbi:DUF6843 domain-containing protein [Marinobacter sp. LN3S78]|uniref:DUF6843 domain-containing protein n=1 Tax=Marinobacter sp. LN3S78 TaxID=3382300 RepID=UPI00387B2596